MTELIVITCPHCNCKVIIEEVNCRIFRHAVYISTGEQMPPHSTKSECDIAIAEGSIHGCGKPFKIELIDNKWVAFECDYI